MKWFVGWLVLLWSGGAWAVDMSCPAPGYSLLSSVVRVSGDDGSRASGVVIDKDKVATAAHVVSGAYSVFVQVNGVDYNAQIMRIDEELDLALLAVPTQDLKPIPVSRNMPVYWQPVWAVGFPLAQAQAATPGFFERVYNGGLQTTADVQSGQSGGALVSCEAGSHVVLGIVRGYGAYPNSSGGFDRLPDFSVSVTANDLSEFIDDAAVLTRVY